jgi:hypothetical protein
MSKPILNDKGHVIGRQVGDVQLDGNGKVVARVIKSSNLTVDGKGHRVGPGNQLIRTLGKEPEGLTS